MSKPILELTKRGEDKIQLYACGSCGRLCSPSIYFTGAANAHAAAVRMAEECCMPTLCDCGKENAKHRTMCPACLTLRDNAYEQAQIDKATKFTVATAPNEPVCYDDDNYHRHVVNLCDALSCDDIPQSAFPLVAWLCDPETPQIDPEQVIDQFTDDLEITGTDLESVTVDITSLYAALREWNAKQEAKIWRPSRNRCVIIQYEDVYANEE